MNKAVTQNSRESTELNSDSKSWSHENLVEKDRTRDEFDICTKERINQISISNALTNHRLL